MIRVRGADELRTAAGNVLFEGARHGDGVELSFFLTSFEPGDGPPRHRHPYAEVFLVQAGEATFAVGGEELVVAGGHVVVVAPEEAHAFRNSGSETLRVLSIQPHREVVQTDVA